MICTLTREQFSEVAKDDEKGKKNSRSFYNIFAVWKKQDI